MNLKLSGLKIYIFFISIYDKLINFSLKFDLFGLKLVSVLFSLSPSRVRLVNLTVYLNYDFFGLDRLVEAR